MNINTARSLSITEIERLLDIISETLSAYEYPTPSIFSAHSHCVIISFLVGRGDEVADARAESIPIFRQLSSHAQECEEYVWFVYWSRKLVDLVRERKISEE